MKVVNHCHTSTTPLVLFGSVLIAACCVLACPARAGAATIPVTNTNDAGPGSLRRAVLNAASGDTITFSPLVFSAPLTITLTSGQIEISKSLTIDGAAGGVPAAPTLSGNGASRVFQVDAGAGVVLNRLIIVNGMCDAGCNGNGSGIDNLGMLSVTNITLAGNIAVVGGAIHSAGLLYVANSSLVNNAAQTGGAIATEPGSATDVTGSAFDDNNATSGTGGAIDGNGTLRVTNTTFFNNSAAIAGGGIFNTSGALSIASSTFVSNSAPYTITGYGGAVGNFGALTIMNDTFRGNRAQIGGAIYTFGNATAVSSSLFAGNHAYNGGGIYNDGSSVLVVTRSTYSANSVNDGVGGQGGGIYNGSGAVLLATNSTFFSNTALSGYGGGIYNTGVTTATNNTLSGNAAPGGGGAGFFNFGAARLVLVNTIVANSQTGENCATLGVSVITDGGYNLEDSNACGFHPYALTHSLTNTNPLLGPSQFNPPGAGLPTLALLPGSPAINAGDDASCPSTDERGVPRPTGPHCDIGAFEYFAVAKSAYLPLLQRGL